MIKRCEYGIWRAISLRYAGAMKVWLCSVCVTKDGKIVSGSWDRTVRVWDMQGNQLAICRGHENWVSQSV